MEPKLNVYSVCLPLDEGNEILKKVEGNEILKKVNTLVPKSNVYLWSTEMRLVNIRGVHR